jgi:cellulose biosynthesis protein BcsQ
MLKARPSAANVITVLSLKGGVGKTHAVWLLSSVSQEREHRILVIDTDMQVNFTRRFLAESGGCPGVEILFHPGAESDPTTLVRRTPYPHIDIIPATAALAQFDVAKQIDWERADLHLALVDPIDQLRSQYDYIVLDCPPRLSLVSFAALCASDHLIIPMEAADWGARGIVQITSAMTYAQSQFKRKLAPRDDQARLRKRLAHDAYVEIVAGLDVKFLSFISMKCCSSPPYGPERSGQLTVRDVPEIPPIDTWLCLRGTSRARNAAER